MTNSETKLFNGALIDSLGQTIRNPELTKQLDARKISRELAADSLSNVTQIIMEELSLESLPIQEAYQKKADSFPIEGIYPNLDGHLFSKRIAGLLVARDLLLPKVINKLSMDISSEELIRILGERKIEFSKIDRSVSLDNVLFAWLVKTIIDNVDSDGFPTLSGSHKESGEDLLSSLKYHGVDPQALFSNQSRYFTRTVLLRGPSDPYPHFTLSKTKTWIHKANELGFKFERIPFPGNSSVPIFGKINLPNDTTPALVEFLYKYYAPEDGFAIVHDNLTTKTRSFDAFELEERSREERHTMALNFRNY